MSTLSWRLQVILPTNAIVLVCSDETQARRLGLFSRFSPYRTCVCETNGPPWYDDSLLLVEDSHDVTITKSDDLFTKRGERIADGNIATWPRQICLAFPFSNYDLMRLSRWSKPSRRSRGTRAKLAAGESPCAQALGLSLPPGAEPYILQDGYWN